MWLIRSEAMAASKFFRETLSWLLSGRASTGAAQNATPAARFTSDRT
jgi:hypothetical protein